MATDHIGRYELRSEVGRGGMATVYRAYDPRFKREVALKLLPREFLHDPLFLARFEREAQTVASLEHPAIVPVYDYGEENGQPYLVMRLMSGGSLAERLGKGPLALADAAAVMVRLGAALDAAHQQGIIHRDLKPANILFDRWGKAYASDFGIAKLAEGAGETLTATGAAVGTPAYMSPEQVTGSAPIDGRSDVYALGIILFEMLAGERPYQATTPMALALKHITEPIPNIWERNQALPADCQAIIERAMAKERQARYPTAGDLAAALATLPGGRLQEPDGAGDDGAAAVVLPSASAAQSEPTAADLTVVPPAWAVTEVAPPPVAVPMAAAAPTRRGLPGRWLLGALLLFAAAVLTGGVLLGAWLLDRAGGESSAEATAPPAATAGVIGPFIDQRWADGFDISAVAYGGGQWAVAMTRGPEDLRQALWRQPDFPGQFIDEKWAEGFDLTALAYGGGQWVVVMSQGSQDLRQSLWRQAEFPGRLVEEKWAEGFELTSLAYGDGQWVVVMSQGSQDWRQSLWRQPDFPSQIVNTRWGEGFDLTALAYGGGQWVVVMSQGGPDLRQSLWRQPAFPDQFVNQKWDEGFNLTGLAHGDGQWAVVMSAGAAGQQQALQLGSGWR